MSRILIAIVAVFSMLPFTAAQPQSVGKPLFRVRKATMTPVELAHGETLVYESGDGETLELKLTGTAARILYTNRERILRDESGNDRGNMYRARLLYTYTINLEVNGIPMTMRRYVGSQESFFEPYVINGVRIWHRCEGRLRGARRLPQHRPQRQRQTPQGCAAGAPVHGYAYLSGPRPPLV